MSNKLGFALLEKVGEVIEHIPGCDLAGGTIEHISDSNSKEVVYKADFGRVKVEFRIEVSADDSYGNTKPETEFDTMKEGLERNFQDPLRCPSPEEGSAGDGSTNS